jgi:DNA repair exonuclease SbcCD ATPase subunit
MMDFQKERMEHIAKKEAEIKHKEQKLLSIEESNNNLNKYKNMINKITSDISNASNELNALTKYATKINTDINNDINRLTKSGSTNGPVISPISPISPNGEMPIAQEKTEKEHFGIQEHFESNIDDLDLPIEDL